MWYLVMTLAALAGQPSERCSLSTMRHLAPRGAVVLAVATGGRVPVSTDSLRFRGTWNFGRRFPGTAPGHVFTVVRSAGDDDGVPSGATITVVPWGYDAACDLERWSAPWVPTGDTVVFRLEATRVSADDAKPVFDVLGWHEPYPTGEFLRYDVRGDDVERRWLTPGEYFEFVQVLPTLDTFESRPLEGLRQIERWVRARPELSEAFPVREVLERWRLAGSLRAGLADGTGRSP
ncbi:MAG: hypothetical protein AMXMBFR53_26400 [Gemmatimonadota bacterium]